MVRTQPQVQIAKQVWLTYYDNPHTITMGDVALELGLSRAEVRSAVQVLVQVDLLRPFEFKAGQYEHDHHDNPTTAFEEAFPMNDETSITHRANEDETGESNRATCRCGCSEAPTSTRTSYRPGHDARHAGNVGRAIALNPDLEVALLGELLTEALRAKAQRVASAARMKAAAKAQRKADKAARRAAKSKTATPEIAEPEFTEGAVKKGRWTYPARAYGSGVVLRNEKRDGSGEWVPFQGDMD